MDTIRVTSGKNTKHLRDDKQEEFTFSLQTVICIDNIIIIRDGSTEGAGRGGWTPHLDLGMGVRRIETYGFIHLLLTSVNACEVDHLLFCIA